jgi:hypothetical protein
MILELMDAGTLTNKEIDKIFFSKDIVVNPCVGRFKDVFVLDVIKNCKRICKSLRKDQS